MSSRWTQEAHRCSYQYSRERVGRWCQCSVGARIAGCNWWNDMQLLSKCPCLHLELGEESREVFKGEYKFHLVEEVCRGKLYTTPFNTLICIYMVYHQMIRSTNKNPLFSACSQIWNLQIYWHLQSVMNVWLFNDCIQPQISTMSWGCAERKLSCNK